MTPQPSLLADLFDFRIFRYWLLALAITIGCIIGLAALGVISLTALIDPVSALSIDFFPESTNSFFIRTMQTVLQFLLGIVIGLVVIFVSWFSFSLTLLAVLSLFNESIIGVIRNKHYPDVELVSGFTFWPMLVEQTKVFAIYIGLLVVGGIVTLIFIFFLSWAAMPLLMIWGFFLYRSLLLIDCGLTIFKSDELRAEKRVTNSRYWPATALTYAMSLVPVLNLFAPLIAIVWMSHIMLERKNASQHKAIGQVQ